MKKDIEEMNRELIKNRIIPISESNPLSTSHINEEILNSIISHRRINGITPDFRIKRSLVKTKPFVKLMKDLWKNEREEDLRKKFLKIA